MPNPAFIDLFGLNADSVTDALTALAVTNPATDARLAVHQIIQLLQTKHDAFVDANGSLTTFSMVREADNIDIDTQRQIFTITFDMKIAATTVENEPT